jgi:AAA family ATP:ADP antiporter
MQRGADELRSGVSLESLRRRATPVTVVLALCIFGGIITEIVANSQILALYGPSMLLVVYPISGVAMLLLALVQFRFVDQYARLRVLRVSAFAYALIFVLAFIIMATQDNSMLGIGTVWLLADQLTVVLPLLLWSLAADEFNAGEARKVFSWIASWTVAASALGPVVALIAAPLLSALALPLPTLLVVGPIVCVTIGIWLPRTLRGTSAGRGLVRPEGLGDSLRSAWDFVNGVPVWRLLLIMSVLTFTAGLVIHLGFMIDVSDLIGRDAFDLQVLFAGVTLAGFAVSWLIQRFVANRIQDARGIPAMIMVLPLAAIVAGLVLALGSIVGSIAVLAVAINIWRIPRYTVSANARRTALTLIPDERRARVAFLVELLPLALGYLIASPLALTGVTLDAIWIPALIASLLALAAVPFALRIVRTWDDGLLNPRLRRRKRDHVEPSQDAPAPREG